MRDTTSLAQESASFQPTGDRGNSASRPRVLLIASVQPDPVGAGWNRRVYQIEHDLERECGANVTVLDAGSLVFGTPPEYPTIERTRTPSRRAVTNSVKRLGAKVLHNPLRLMSRRTRFSTTSVEGDSLMWVERYLAEQEPFDAVVCDSVQFASAVNVLTRWGIPAFYALHHIESLNHGQKTLLQATRGSRRTTGRPSAELLLACADLADEIAALACAQRVFAISEMEQQLLAATGLETAFYPYQPVGETLKWCREIRAQRRSRPPSTVPKRFVYSGTLNGHNEESLRLVLDAVLQRGGMPPGTELVLTGMQPEALIEAIPALGRLRNEQGIRIAGRLSEEDFTETLLSATAVVVPRYFGFGALTRFADAAASGIFVLTNAPGATTGLGERQAWTVERPQDWYDAFEGLSPDVAFGGDMLDGPEMESMSSPLREIGSQIRKR